MTLSKYSPSTLLCAAQAETPQDTIEREPPPQIKREWGRRPTVDTGRQFCPEELCRYYGWLGWQVARVIQRRAIGSRPTPVTLATRPCFY